MQNLPGIRAKDSGRHHSRKDNDANIADLVIVFIVFLVGVLCGNMIGTFYHTCYSMYKRNIAPLGGPILAVVILQMGTTKENFISFGPYATVAWFIGILVRIVISAVRRPGQPEQLTKSPK